MKQIQPAAMKIGEAAKYLNISTSLLRDLADSGEIRCHKLNRDRYFNREDLDEWRKNLPLWVNGNGENTQTG